MLWIEGNRSLSSKSFTRDINKFFNLSRKYKLCVSGGSDYHGRHIGSDNLSIGSYGLNEECLNKFINFDKRK